MGKRVPLLLVVDPDPTVSECLREELSAFEAEVMATYTVRETLVAMLERTVPLAVVNMTLPECSAGRLVPAIRRAQSDVIVILTTDEHSEEVERKARGLGITLYLPKPIAPGLLGEAVRSALGLEPRRDSGIGIGGATTGSNERLTRSPGSWGEVLPRVVH
jgi:DNA-binding response OmpR family regulator